jgi:hypothetical protein
VSLKVRRLDVSNDLAMREVGDDASESKEAVEGQDVKTGLCLVDVQVYRSGIHCSRDVCQQLLGHDSAPALLSVDGYQQWECCWWTNGYRVGQGIVVSRSLGRRTGVSMHGWRRRMAALILRRVWWPSRALRIVLHLVATFEAWAKAAALCYDANLEERDSMN